MNECFVVNVSVANWRQEAYVCSFGHCERVEIVRVFESFQPNLSKNVVTGVGDFV